MARSEPTQSKRRAVEDLAPGDEIELYVIASNEGWEWTPATVLTIDPLRVRWWDGEEKAWVREGARVPNIRAMRKEPKTWPNGVPYFDAETRRANLNDPVKLRDLICTLELHSAYHGRDREAKLTTEQKELYADVVDADSEAGGFDYRHDRWWRDA